MRSMMFAFGVCALHMTAAGQVQFQCVIDSNKMLIGDQRELTLVVQSNRDIQVDSVDFRAWNNLGVELLEPQNWSSIPTNRYEQHYKIGVFDTGYLKLPPLPMYFSMANRVDTVFSNDLALEVFGITVDSTGLAPIKPILKEPLTFRDFLPYLIALAVGAAIIGLIFLRRKRSQPEPEIIIIPDPPHEIALRKLKLLQEQQLWQQGKIKAYQTELTHIIREYLEGRFKIPALESTTTEVLEAMDQVVVPDDIRQHLDQILNMADLIKFAKAKPDVDIHSQFMTKAEQFVMATQTRVHLEESAND